MKKHIITYSTIMFFAAFFALSTPVLAAEPIDSAAKSVESESSGIVPYSDIIEYRYKNINGKLYCRLYNYTRDEWAEPYWHLVG